MNRVICVKIPGTIDAYRDPVKFDERIKEVEAAMELMNKSGYKLTATESTPVPNGSLMFMFFEKIQR